MFIFPEALSNVDLEFECDHYEQSFKLLSTALMQRYPVYNKLLISAIFSYIYM